MIRSSNSLQNISKPSVQQNFVKNFSKVGKGLLVAGACITSVLVADMFVNRGRTGEKLEFNESTHLIESVPVSYYERVKDEIANNPFTYPHVTLPGKVNDAYCRVKKDINVLVNKDKKTYRQINKLN